MESLLFWTLATVTVVSAVGVVVTQNIVRAAVWLLLALGGTAGVFFLLGADFVGATQLLVYVGGTLVLVVFGVMLTTQGPFVSMKTGAAEWGIAAVVGLVLYAAIAYSVLRPQGNLTVNLQEETRVAIGQHGGAHAPGVLGDDPAAARNTVAMGQAFLNVTSATPDRDLTGVPGGVAHRGEMKRRPMGYLLPFEIVSVHLLVVLIGAAYLARAKRRRGVSS